MGHIKRVFCMKGRAWTLFTSNDAAALLAYKFCPAAVVWGSDRHLLKSSLMYIEIERSWLRWRGWRCFRVLNKNMVLTLSRRVSIPMSSREAYLVSCAHRNIKSVATLGFSE
jgi:hypothetical protein